MIAALYLQQVKVHVKIPCVIQPKLANLDFDRAEDVDDGRPRPPEGLAREPLSTFPVALLEAFRGGTSIPPSSSKSRSSCISRWLRLRRLPPPAFVTGRLRLLARGAPFEAAATLSITKRKTTAKPNRAYRPWPMVDSVGRLLSGVIRVAGTGVRSRHTGSSVQIFLLGKAFELTEKPFPSCLHVSMCLLSSFMSVISWFHALGTSHRSRHRRRMKTVVSSLCVLAGAGLANAFLTPSVPVARRLSASSRRASSEDTLVASAGNLS